MITKLTTLTTLTTLAPGKLFLTGAYAVLEGAPALVVAVDRYARAFVGAGSEAPEGKVTAEIAALARRLGVDAPHVDTRDLERDGRKLGLGSSAAAVVAAAAALLLARGGDLDADRELVLRQALDAHREIQPRGSGGDVAAAAMGGVIAVSRPEALVVERLALPPQLVLRAFAARSSARTSDALDRLAARRGDAAVGAAMGSIAEAARAGHAAFACADVSGFLGAAQAHVDGLAALGRALDLPLVPPEVTLARGLLERDILPGNRRSIVLLPSGAGGGDTVVWLGARAPTDHEAQALGEAGLTALSLGLSSVGVHRAPSPSGDDGAAGSERK